MKKITLLLLLFFISNTLLRGQCNSSSTPNGNITKAAPTCNYQNQNGISPKEAINFAVTNQVYYQVDLSNQNWSVEEVSVFNNSTNAYLGGAGSTAGGNYIFLSNFSGTAKAIPTSNCATTGSYGWFSGMQSAVLSYRKVTPTVSIDQGTTMPVCGTTTLTATFTYDANGVSWSKISGAGSIGSSSGLVTGLTPNTSSVFRATVNNGGCIASDDITLVASDVPTATGNAPSCNGTCDGSVDFSSGTEVVAANDVEFFHGFNGTTISNIFTRDNIGTYTQNDQLAIADPVSAWNKFFYTNQTFTRAEDKTFSFRYFNGIQNWNMIGWHGNGNTSTNRYTNMLYALYFQPGGINIYEDGASRGNFNANIAGGFTENTWYDCKIVLKAAGGANYYVRKQGQADYSLIYSSAYSTETNLRLGTTYLRYNKIITDTWVVYNESTPAPTFGLCAGTYDYVITNAAGCSAEVSVVVPAAPSALSLTANATDETCPGDCDGSVSLSANGGTSPYTFAGASLLTDHFSGNDEGLILHLPLDYTAEDISPADQATGTISAGINFPGDGSVDFSSSTGINMGVKGRPYLTDATTVSYWIYSNNVASPARQNPFNQAYGGWGTQTLETSGAISWFFGDNGGNANNYGSHQSPAGTIVAGQWIHITCTRDPSTNTFRWYKNGALLSSGSYSANYPVIANQVLTIGDGYVNPINGKMSDFRIYNRALSANEIAELHNRSSHDYIYRSGGGELDHENGYFKFTNNNDSWDQEMYTAATYPRVDGISMQAQVKLNALNPTRSMVGWHNQSTAFATATYRNLVHAIYFTNGGGITIYEDGNFRANVGSFTFGLWYDVKIELLPTGALYYYKLTTASNWILLYTSSYSSQSNLSPGIAHLGLESFYLDNLNVNNPMEDQSGLCAGTYNYTVIDANGCTAAASATIGTQNTLSTNPTGANGGTTICIGTSTSISVAGGSLGTGSSWEWYTGSCGGTSVGSGASISVSPTTNTEYFVRAEGPCNNTICRSVTINVDPLPYATISGTSSTICVNGSQGLSGDPNTNGSVLWTHNGAGSLSNPTTFSPVYNAAPGDAGNTVTLTMTVTSTNACSPATAADTYTIDVDPLPYATISGTSSTICVNGSEGLSGDPNTNGSVLWTHNGAGSLSNPTTFSPVYNAAPGDAGNTVTLTMTVTSTNACSPATATDTYTIDVDPLPYATISGTSSTICVNGSQGLSGDPNTNGSVLWTHNGAGSLSNPTTFSPVYNAAPGDAGNTITLTMTVTSTNTCSPATATDTYTIDVDPLPYATISGTSSTICVNGSQGLSGDPNTNGSVLWTHNGAGSLSNPTTFSPVYNAAPGDAGNTVTLTMTVTSTNACSPATAADTYTINVSELPTTASAGTGFEACLGLPSTMAANNPTVGTGAWTWTPSTPTYVGGTSASDYNAQVVFASAGTYTGTWSISNGACATSSDNVIVTVKSAATNVTLVASTSVTATAVCVESPWTYYANPATPDEYIFAIAKNGNTFTANVSITDVPGTAPIESLGGQPNVRGTWLISRYWNVSLASGTITNPVSVRFFIDDQERIDAFNDATAFAAANPWPTIPVSVSTLQWFKTTGAAFNPSTDLINGDFTFTPTYLTSNASGTINGVQYYEFNTITSFSGGTGGFTVNDAPSPLLPVELVSWKAKAIDNEYIALDWSTATEVNNDGFEILRGTDGVNFERIAWVEGNGNSTVINNYSYEDREVSKGITYYYQLKQVDYDGEFELFNIVSAKLEGERIFKIGSLIPNPTSTNTIVSVDVFSLSNELINVSIYNHIGVQVNASQEEIFEGTNNVKFSINNLASGTYFINFEGSFGRETKKLVIVN